MSTRSLIDETVAELLDREVPRDAALSGGQDEWRQDLWERWSELGLATTSAPEELDGGGLSLSETCGILRVAARKAAPLPVAETDFLATWLISQCGEPAPAGPLTVAPVDLDRGALAVEADGDQRRLAGSALRVPWARLAHRIVVLLEDALGPAVAIVDPASCDLTRRPTVSPEPRDDVDFGGATLDHLMRPRTDITAVDLHYRGALARSVQMLGAMESVLDLTVTYARDRHQFGRAISRFQAVQHQLAGIARDVALVRSAVELAIEAASQTLRGAFLPIAVAKALSSRRAGAVARRAHQVHGAIGFTSEYRLHLFTTRLWEWREEFGSEEQWEQVIGRQALEAPELWDFITNLGVVR